MHQLEVIKTGELSYGRILEWRDVGQEALDAFTKKMSEREEVIIFTSHSLNPLHFHQ